jgi:hypothetical protein
MKPLTYIKLALVITFFSCRKDFIVENIDKKTVTINSPANNLTTSVNTITFWWEEVDGAENYNLQVVQPDFTSITKLILDTIVTVTKFDLNLEPGTYQWRIKAKNAGHSTTFQTYNLKIDTTSDLTRQFVNLLTPVNNTVTGNTVVTFTWKSIKAAQKYRLQINNGLIKDTTVIGTALTYTLLAAKNNTTSYTWNVKAMNSATESEFNTTSFKFIVDLKGPGTPGLSAPSQTATVHQTDSLKWTRANDVQYDSVYVADDSTFINLLQQVLADGTFIKISDLSLSPNTEGMYYWWKVRSFDIYGNPSSYSLRRKFKLN